jgi:peroxiredoxin
VRRSWLPLLTICWLLAICLMFQVGFGAENTVKDFTLPSATDNSLIQLANYAGKVVLINFWRTSCAWSQKESPRLVDLYKQYRDKGLVIVGVSDDTADTVAQVSAYLNRYGIAWPVGLNDQGEFQHEIVLQSKAGDKPAGETPGNYIVSRSGKLTYLGLDRSPEAWDKLAAAVRLALDEKAPVTAPIPPRALESAPPLGLSDLQGRPVTLTAFAGKPLVVNFFNAATCDWTGAVMSKLHQDYAGRGLGVVGINLYDSDDAIRQCTARYSAHYVVLRGDQATQMAWIGDSKAWATFFVLPNGKVFKKVVDSIDNGIEGPVFSKYAEYLSTKP